MSRYLVWLLGGGSVAAAGAVTLWLTTGTHDLPTPAAEGIPPSVPASGPDAAPAEPVSEPSNEVASDTRAEGPVEAIAATPPAADSEEPVAPQSEPPAFDVVRVARDGAALVAGSAEPGAAVVLRVDGQVVAETAADGGGQFVALFSLDPGEVPQVMTLEMQDAAGAVTQSQDTVILSPRPAEIAALSVDTIERETVPEEPGAPVVPQATPDVMSVPAAEAYAVARPEEPGADELSDAEPAPASAAESPRPAADPGRAEPLATGETETASDTPARDTPPNVTPASDTAAGDTAANATPDRDGAGIAVAEAQEALASAPEPEPAAPEFVEPPRMEPAATPETPPFAATAASEEVASVPLAMAAPHDSTAPFAAAAEPPTAILLRGDGRIEVLEPGPSVMDNVVIDTISYTETGDVQISGRAAQAGGAADLRIYLDNEPIAAAQAEGGDWRLDLPSVDPGVYNLRVDQLSPAGRVVSRFETPFQRETPERVAAAQSAARASAANTRALETVAGAETTAAVEAGDSAGEAAPRAQGAQPATGPTGARIPEAIPEARVAAVEQAATPEQTAQPAPEDLAEIVAAESAEPQSSVNAAPEVQTAATATVVAPASAPAPVVAPSPAVSQATGADTAPQVSLITVQPGHTLWHISDQRYGAGERYVIIYSANRSQIRDPDLIYPGQIFTLPDE